MTNEPLPLALISGGTSGIGLATARRLHGRYRLALLYGQNAERAAQAAAELEGARTYGLDLTRAEQVDTSYAQIEADFGVSPQVLVNSAGSRGRNRYMLQGLDLEDCARLMDLHFFGSLRLVQKVLPSMYARRRGSILNLSSVSAQGGYKGVVGYAESKAAVECFTRNLAMEVGHRGIAVNCVCPGLVASPMTQEFQADYPAASVNAPLGRWIEAEEVASVIDFLVHAGPAINGQIVTVDGASSLAKIQLKLSM